MSKRKPVRDEVAMLVMCLSPFAGFILALAVVVIVGAVNR